MREGEVVKMQSPLMHEACDPAPYQESRYYVVAIILGFICGFIILVSFI